LKKNNPGHLEIQEQIEKVAKKHLVFRRLVIHCRQIVPLIGGPVE
jgi:hypothetical protein